MFILNRILWILNIIAAMALMLAYAAPYVNPMIWWMAAFFGLAFPVLFIANLIFVIYWLIQGKLKVFFSAIVLLMGYSHYSKIVKINGEEAEHTEENTLLVSMNVKNFGWGTKEVFFDSMLHYLSDVKPEIVCFQEFPHRKGDRKLETSAELKKKLKMRHLVTNVPSGDGIGVVLFTRYKMLKSGIIKFPETIGNGAVWADLIIRKDTVRVYSVHLQSNKLSTAEQFQSEDMEDQEKAVKKSKSIIKRLKSGFEKRSEQVELLLEHMEDSPYPIIIAGDMNDTQLSYTYRKLRGEGKDAFVESGEGAGNTYVGPFPSYRIDYIFIPESFSSFSYKSGAHWSSDHKLIQTLIQH
ncbi:MAG: hypothetical protein EP332_06620 [Bacteroidetes bacterium]|nr:MAG: hypothetical protein EP332_06620 [Bacteroidota bacterium]